MRRAPDSGRGRVGVLRGIGNQRCSGSQSLRALGEQIGSAGISELEEPRHAVDARDLLVKGAVTMMETPPSSARDDVAERKFQIARCPLYMRLPMMFLAETVLSAPINAIFAI